MAEIKLTRIRSRYGDLKGLLSQIPLEKEKSVVDKFIVNQINSILDILSIDAETDYSSYKVPDDQADPGWNYTYPSGIVRTQLGRVISRLEEEFNFSLGNKVQAPGIVIFNKNENEISLKINYTITDLVEKYPDEETKRRLSQLEDQLNKPSKNWDIIKGVLIWILNFSKDLFLEVVPIIIQKNYKI